jgi:hypothetical protein
MDRGAPSIYAVSVKCSISASIAAADSVPAVYNSLEAIARSVDSLELKATVASAMSPADRDVHIISEKRMESSRMVSPESVNK